MVSGERIAALLSGRSLAVEGRIAHILQLSVANSICNGPSSKGSTTKEGGINMLATLHLSIAPWPKGSIMRRRFLLAACAAAVAAAAFAASAPTVRAYDRGYNHVCVR